MQDIGRNKLYHVLSDKLFRIAKNEIMNVKVNQNKC